MAHRAFDIMEGIENNLESEIDKESMLNILASEEVLSKDWNNKKDEEWNNV